MTVLMGRERKKRKKKKDKREGNKCEKAWQAENKDEI